MNLDLVLGCNLLGNQELLGLDTMISLQLDDFTHIIILDDVSIAGEFLLEGFEDTLLVQIGWDALDSGQGLSSISLLDTNV